MFAPLYIYSYITGALATAPARNERGASFTEYVVLLGVVVAMVLAVGFGGLQTKLSDFIDNISLS